jgi:CDP-diacylglycerol--serine O-phosphatidyltransferase
MASSARPRALRRGAYLLPSLFTVGNVFCGYFALMETWKGAVRPELAAPHLDAAAKAIGFAVLLDGLDGRIARMTGTSSDFGREFDSLADVITFGIAPALLAYTWGIRWLDPMSGPLLKHIQHAGWFLSFLFLICGAARLARFNITANPVPANPGRPGRKYFVGLPIPAAAALVAAVVHVFNGEPLFWWPWAVVWLALFTFTALLMVSRWRYNSFKHVDLRRSRRFIMVVSIGVLIAAIWFYSEPVLLALALAYVGSGVVTRLAGILRRILKRRSLRPFPPHSDLPAGA